MTVQILNNADYPRCLTFAVTKLNIFEENEEVAILMSDEAISI